MLLKMPKSKLSCMMCGIWSMWMILCLGARLWGGDPVCIGMGRECEWCPSWWCCAWRFGEVIWWGCVMCESTPFNGFNGFYVGCQGDVDIFDLAQEVLKEGEREMKAVQVSTLDGATNGESIDQVAQVSTLKLAPRSKVHARFVNVCQASPLNVQEPMFIAQVNPDDVNLLLLSLCSMTKQMHARFDCLSIRMQAWECPLEFEASVATSQLVNCFRPGGCSSTERKRSL